MRPLLCAFTASVLLGLACPPLAMGEEPDPHAAHRAAMAQQLKRSEATYSLPAVSMVREDGHVVGIQEAIDDGRPVFVNFIYTTCTTICPLSSQVFSQLQARLGADRDKVHLVSISIDPEQDTPARLREYAERFHAGSNWNHYPGTTQASVTVQRAFDAYRGDKMNHTALTLWRPAHAKTWVRLDGFASADTLLNEYHGAHGAP